MTKFFVTQIPADAPTYASEAEAIEAAKVQANANPGAMFFVADEDDSVLVPKPDAQVTDLKDPA